MLDFGQAVPAEEEQADQRRFEEKNHQTFARENRAEDIADIGQVIGLIGAELEFQRQTRRHNHREIDAEQLAPEFRHVLVDFLCVIT